MRLERFKNFRDATLELGPLTVIVGTNASGKSNLRDAFRFVHGMSRGYSLAEIIGEKYIEGGVLQWKGIRGGTREVVYAGEHMLRLTTTVLSTSVQPLVHKIVIGIGDVESGPRLLRESLYGSDGLIFESHGLNDPPQQEGTPYVFVRLPRDARNRKHGKRLRFLDNKPIISQFAYHPALSEKTYLHAANITSSSRRTFIFSVFKSAG